MPNYSAEPVPSQIVKTMLDDNWSTFEGFIPKPTLVDVNEGADRQIRVDLRQGDHIVIRVDTPAEEEVPIGNWVYGNRTTRMLLEIFTETSRQRLYDLLQEVRRICHSQMHNLTDYQRIRYNTFNELTQEQVNLWRGRVVITLENSAVLLET